MRFLDEEKIRRDNEKLGLRIVQKSSSSSYSVGKFDEGYNNHIYYKNFNKKFYLPKIEETGNKFINKSIAMKNSMSKSTTMSTSFRNNLSYS
jgi:hypothetical protein